MARSIHPVLMLLGPFSFLAVLGAGAARGAPAPAATVPVHADLDGLRRWYLDEIHVLRDYRPGKASYVEGPDRRWGCYTGPGQRLTLLDVAGQGSLRHIWSTWRPGQGKYRLDFFVDGEKQPSLSATLDELIEAAQRMPSPPLPVPGFVGNRDARNLFLPVPFERALRIEMETLEPTWLIFWQLDYRTGDPSLAGCRLEARRTDGRLALHWRSPAVQAPPPRHPTRTVRQSVDLPPRGTAVALRLDGPAIVRRLSVEPAERGPLTDKIELQVRYDEAPRAAVRAAVGDFFGPFRGVSLDTTDGRRTCYLPMPFRRAAEIRLSNPTDDALRVDLAADVQQASAWDERWGYFHALGQCTAKTSGYRQHQVLYVHGRGHWLGMALYNTGHDHGGGDFAVIDGEGRQPAFLHGINGEDYFTFAWFGRGAHPPYAVAHTNEQGRYRHHFENPYPFRESLSIYWGTYPDLATRSVAYWYQTSPDDTTLADQSNPRNVVWDCFGPVPIRLDAAYRPAGDPFAVLPAAADLDAGKRFECRCVRESFTTGWMKQRSIGPMLDLTYLSRHGTPIKGEVELGGMGHAYLARRSLPSASARRAEFAISHDDPIRVLVNGTVAYSGPAQRGFSTARFPVDLRAGDNEVLVQLSNYFNTTFNWAGFALATPE